MTLHQIIETHHRHLKPPPGSDLKTAEVLLAVADVESGDRDRGSGLVVPGSPPARTSRRAAAARWALQLDEPAVAWPKYRVPWRAPPLPCGRSPLGNGSPGRCSP